MSQSPMTLTNVARTLFRSNLNAALAALSSCQSGTSRPTDIPAGGLWVNTTTATAWVLNLYDGADDIAIGTFNTTTNVFTPSIANNSILPSKLSTGAPSWGASGNLSFNSGYGSVATAYGCRAWVSFNGTGTVAIRGSGNVTSITDVSTGVYTVNFTTAMPDANYCVVLGGDNIDGVGNSIINTGGGYNTSNVSIIVTDYTNTFRDESILNAAVFR